MSGKFIVVTMLEALQLHLQTKRGMEDKEKQRNINFSSA